MKINTAIKPHLFLFQIIFTLSLLNSCGSNEGKNPKEIVLDSLIYKDGTKELFSGRAKGKVGNKTVEYDVVKGRKHGEFRLYYETGKLEIEGRIENNRNTGIWKYYYSNGKLESEGYFKNDLVDGKWIWYYENGELKEVSEFKEGKRNGKSFLYDEKGNIISENIYVDGKILNEN